MKWAGVMFLLAACAQAQDLRRFDVTATVPIVDANSSWLPGNSLVQILDTGANGTAELPDLAGNATGDDTVFATTVIGQGIAPNVPVSGRFSVSFYPPPADGKKLYARVFTANAWGQSGSFIVDHVKVFDVSVAGLAATTVPVGRDPTVTDSDGDGQSDYAELIANTNAQDANDQLKLAAFTPASLTLAGRAGRQYTLERTTDELSGAPTWTPLTVAGPLSEDQTVMLADPSPPSVPKAFYRVHVRLP